MILIYILSLISLVITIISIFFLLENNNKYLGEKFYKFEKSTHLFFSSYKVFKYFFNNYKDHIKSPEFSNFTLFQPIDNIDLSIKVETEDGKIPLKNSPFYISALSNLLNILDIEDNNNFLEDIKNEKIKFPSLKNYFMFINTLKKYFPDNYKKLEKYISPYNSKVNINTASVQVILSLDSRITSQEAINIINARPIKNILDLQKYLPSEVFWTIYPYIKIKPDYFCLYIKLENPQINYNMTGEFFLKDKDILFYYFNDNWDRKWILNFLKEEK